MRKRFHGVLVELRIDAVHQLDAVHRTVLADDRVEHHFAFHVILNQLGRILRIHFLERNRAGKLPLDDMPARLASSSCAKFTIQLPATLVRFGRLMFSV